MLQSGWDCFTPDAGTCDSKNCPTCTRPMAITRNCVGPRGSVANMAMRLNPKNHSDFVPYDLFQCENAKDPKHQQARDLFKLARDTPSPTLRGIYLEDAKEIVCSL